MITRTWKFQGSEIEESSAGGSIEGVLAPDFEPLDFLPSDSDLKKLPFRELPPSSAKELVEGARVERLAAKLGL